jgi:hypothetical protein
VCIVIWVMLYAHVSVATLERVQDDRSDRPQLNVEYKHPSGIFIDDWQFPCQSSSESDSALPTKSVSARSVSCRLSNFVHKSVVTVSSCPSAADCRGKVDFSMVDASSGRVILNIPDFCSECNRFEYQNSITHYDFKDMDVRVQCTSEDLTVCESMAAVFTLKCGPGTFHVRGQPICQPCTSQPTGKDGPKRSKSIYFCVDHMQWPLFSCASQTLTVPQSVTRRQTMFSSSGEMPRTQKVALEFSKKQVMFLVCDTSVLR